MPSLDVLDALKDRINALGDEPRVLAERGQTLEDVRPPEAPLDAGLEQLLDSTDEADGIDEMEALLGGLDAEETEAIPGLEDLEDIEDFGAGDLDDLGDLGDLDLAEEPEAAGGDATGGESAGMEAPGGELGDDLGDLEAGAPGGELPGDEAFSLDDLDFGDFADGLEGEGIPPAADIPDEIPEIPEPGEAPEAESALGAEPEGGGIADFGDIEDLGGFDDLGDLGDFELAEEPEAAGEDVTGEDVTGEEAIGEEAAGMESPGEDLGDLGAGAPGEELLGEDAFSLDDLDFGEAVEGLEGEGAPPAADIPDEFPEIPEPGEAPAAESALGAEPEGAEIEDLGDIEDFGGLDDLGDLGDFDLTDEPEAAGGDVIGEEAAGMEAPGGELGEDLGDLEAGAPDEDMPGDESFSLDDLDFGDAASSAADIPDEIPEMPELGEEPEPGSATDEELGDEPEGAGIEDLGDIEDLGAGDLEDAGEIGDLEDLSDLESLEEPSDESPAEDIPDVAAAMEGLGDADASEEMGEELTIDEELNFDEELGADVLSDIREVGEESQQFSMEDFGDQYNFSEGAEGFTEELGVDLDQLERSLDEAAEDETREFSISEDDFLALRQTLSELPRNLKIAIEELLADERRNPEDLKPLIDDLVAGEMPKTLAARFRTITKRKIELPRSYEKRSGRALEARRAALAYQLVREGWPVVRTVLLVISLVWVTGAGLFMWVYRPIKAERLYEQGLQAIATDDVALGEQYFSDAWDGWPLFLSDEPGADRVADAAVVVRGWKNSDRWLDYARSLRRRKHWDAAGRFYEGYLAVKPDSRDARLEYAAFLSKILGRYPEAVDVLESAPPGRRKFDRDYTLAAGDVYLDWAEDDPTKYEDARFRYAKVLEISRNDEQALLSMMRYHLRVGNDGEVETLMPAFDREVPGRTEAPALAAEVYAGLGDYHLRRGETEESRRFIRLALAADPTSPDPSYADARYWRSTGDSARELDAYERTLINLDGREYLERRHLEMRILSLGGLGRIHAARALGVGANPEMAASSRRIAAENFAKAINLYEDARSRNQLGVDPRYGQIYLDTADLLYRGPGASADLPFTLAENREALAASGDRYDELRRAGAYYDEAESIFDRGGFGSRLPDEALYRRAYVRYLLGREGALVDFHRAARRRPDDYEVRLALGTVLLDSEDFEASRSQYARALDLLDDELRRTGGELNPFERQGHAELLLRYVAAWNNLGVGRARSAARGGGDDDYAAALSAFAMASEYLDEVYDDMENLTSRGAVSLRDLEDRRIVVESVEDGRNLLKEKTTYPYRNRLRLLGLESADAGEDAYLVYPDIPSDLSLRY